MRTPTPAALAMLAVVLLHSPAVQALEPCAGFKWDVTKERALFAGHATPLATGKDAGSAPVIEPDRLYELTLKPQTDVTFVSAPGKKMLSDGAYAGLATLKLAKPGDYRVSVDLPFWLDLVADGKLAATRDFQGQRGCDAPHKIVEFDLRGATRFVLQVSGAAQGRVHLTVTQAPPQP